MNMDNFLRKSEKSMVIDVRTTNEFKSGHMARAINIPLFTNKERAVVGTIYKQKSKQAAIIKGLEIVGPKMADFVTKVKKKSKKNEIFIHCWRGGMRSSSFAWLMETAGYKAFTLEKGYKNYRQHVLNSFNKQLKIIVIGGMTGSGKTPILYELKKRGYQILDLEKLASHKGSSFGKIGEKEQPTNEQFENNLFHAINSLDLNQVCFIEDESRMIGKLNLPNGLYNQIRMAKVIKLDVLRKLRINHLVKNYSNTEITNLLEASDRLKKRLGGLKLKQVRAFLLTNDFNSAASILLDYYDKAYLYGLSQRPGENIITVKTNAIDPVYNTNLILDQLPES